VNVLNPSIEERFFFNNILQDLWNNYLKNHVNVNHVNIAKKFKRLKSIVIERKCGKASNEKNA